MFPEGLYFDPFLVGFCSLRKGKLFDVNDQALQRSLPQHDFNVPEVNITPSTFRFLRYSVENIQGKYVFYKVTVFCVLIIRNQLCANPGENPELDPVRITY